MTRTQIQLPDEVHARAKRFCEAKEMSLAELARRGIEMVLGQYPPPEKLKETWQLPLVKGMGWNGLSDAEIKDLAQKTALEEELEESARHHAQH